jgi:hypothetical protein
MRSDGRTDDRFWDAIDDNFVSGIEARANYTQTTAQITSLNDFWSYHVVSANGQDNMLRLIWEYRGVWYEQRCRRVREN